jgi:hypothetical protein
MGSRVRQGTAAGVMLVGLLGVAAAAPASVPRAELQVGLSARAPGASTGVSIHVLYRHPDDPNRKPPALTKAVFELPAGTRLDGRAVPQCHATDDELQSNARDACPAASKVGDGTFTAMTGLPGADPFDTDTTLYNGGDQIIELVTFKGTNVTAGFDRLSIRGNALVAHPPATPGGPPDGRTVPRDIAATIPRRGGFIISPTSCPAGGVWSSRGLFEFADGGHADVTAPTPCEPGSARRQSARCTLRVAPRRVRAGRRVRLRVRTRPGRAVVRLGRHRVRTNSRGRATMRLRFRSTGRRRVTLVKRGCARKRARLTVLPGR